MITKNEKLIEILAQEQSIFRVFSSSKELSDKATAFVCPDSDEEPHWNMVYPAIYDHQFTNDELKMATEYYVKHNKTGHLAFFYNIWKDKSVETSEYFYFDGKSESQEAKLDVKGFSIVSEDDLDAFCFIVQKAFKLNDETMTYFKSKIGLFDDIQGTKFLVVSHEGQPCGCVSTFRTDSGADFMFNFAVLPGFQGKKIGTRLLKYITRQTDRLLYTYSHNPKMRSTLLPNAGFISVGVLHVVPINKLG